MNVPVTAVVVLEILGAPKEHIEKSLKDYVENVKKAQEVLKEEFHPAREKDKMWSAFYELEIKFKNPLELLDFCFESMPGSVEIVEPDSITFNTNDLTDFLNDLQSRLHFADMTVKNLKAEKAMLDNNAVTIFRNFIVRLLQQGPKTLQQLSEGVGVQDKELKPFVDKLLESGKVKKQKDVYHLEDAQKQN